MPNLVLDCPELRPSKKEVESCTFQQYIEKHEKLLLSKWVTRAGSKAPASQVVRYPVMYMHHVYSMLTQPHCHLT